MVRKDDQKYLKPYLNVPFYSVQKQKTRVHATFHSFVWSLHKKMVIEVVQED